MSTPSLPLSGIVPVSVVISPVGTPGPTFNQALIVGSSTVITPAQRLLQFTSTAAMTAAGFSTTSPEFEYATLYFAQSPAPTYLWVGVQVLTALQTVAVDAAGTGYAVGDILSVAGGTGGQVSVTAIGGSGAVTGIAIVPTAQGSGYAIAIGEATTAVTGSGSGCTVTITEIGESPVQAINACRLANPIWYIVTFDAPQGISVVATTGTASSGSTALTVANGASIAVGQIVVGTNIAPGTSVAAVSGTSVTLSQNTTGSLSGTAVTFYAAFGDTDKEAIAAYIEGATPPGVYFLTSGSSAVLNNTANNLFAVLQNQAYNRTLGIYTTTQGGVYPNNPHASAAAAGFAMGSNTGLPGSYFNLMFKQLTGIAPEPLSVSQVNVIAGPANRSTTGLDGNVYLNYANSSYKFLQNGTMFSGRFFDITLFLDVLSSNIQINVMNLLTGQPSVPLNQSGILQVTNAITQACVTLQEIGFINTSGTWSGVTIQGVTVGTAMPKGYLVLSPPASSLTQGQRAARQLPPVNVLIILAESGQSLAVSIDVQY